MYQFEADELMAIEKLLENGANGLEGLPLKVFELVSALTPIPNVDLLVINSNQELLLSWRDDPYYGKGWHLPGGCIRFGETMEERLQKTAIAELGCSIIHDQEALAVRDALRREKSSLANKHVRGHNLTVLYRCYMPECYDPAELQIRKEGENGYLRWFSEIPANLLAIHSCYGSILFDEMCKGEK